MVSEEVEKELGVGCVNNSLKKKCSSCNNEFKYKCPACDARSCSLECVRMHKRITGCDGNYLNKHISRDITINQYTVNDLVRDHNFLQEVRRGIAGVKGNNGVEFKTRTDSNIRKSLKNQTKLRRQTPIPLLTKACSKRNIRISFCPVSGMQIRKQNTTYYDKKNDHLYWKIEFNIFKRECTDIRSEIEGVNDISYVNKAERINEDKNCVMFRKIQIDNISEEEKVSERLSRISDSLSNANICYLCGTSNVDDSSDVADMNKLDVNKTFRENFSGKKMVEFPRIKVVI
ncbi:hypothetical protein FG379_002758 [Cryptosporidium bovis]|uniref:uncharacterized protein n=1 Tax=Cryptosporidium bovis TaxID=310047 RepID=UPI00351A4DE9|nr:hypothetical protein FG379_002758 [Cryptosporidium bovis]